MKTNEFARMSGLVNTVLTEYRNVRKECNISDTAWHSRTIEALAQPFLKGYFTLAVVGKVSSGKSTFINALLGCKDLLPTGHDQTTCGITYIEYGLKPEVTITFGDGHKKTIKDDIKGKIKPFVAIPEKYHNLPVNNIDDMIMGGYDFNKIWEVHEILEAETLCAKINKDLLRDYVTHRTKKDIAVEVRMKYPFNEELKGWRVIDTPGIGAIGGIETKTRKLLASQNKDGSREVDAIIFLQNGSETLDQTDTKKFVSEQLETLTTSDKHRLFYVLTHSSDTDFLNYKESKMEFIEQNYGDKIKRLTYADSLLYTFLSDLKESDVDLKAYDDFEQPNDWAEDEWDVIMGILFQARQHLRKVKDSFNHDTMLRTIVEWAHFDALKSDINEFAKNEKKDTLSKLLNLIASDYLGFIKQLEEEKKSVEGGIDKINSDLKKVVEKRKGYNLIARDADEKIKRDELASKFKFVDDKITIIRNLDSESKVRTAITDLFDQVQDNEKKLFEEIKKKFQDFFINNAPEDIIIESLDFENIESEATSQSQEEYEISPARTVSHWCSEDDYIPAKYGMRTDPDKKLRNFKTLAISRVRVARDKFIQQVKEKADNMRNKIFEELSEKLTEETKRLENLKSQIVLKKEFKEENDAKIVITQNASKQLIKEAENYGYKL